MPVFLMVPNNMTTRGKRDFLIQLYELLFQNMGMNERIDSVKAMINNAQEHQIDLEIETLKNGQFQKVVSALVNTELTNEEMAHVQALYMGIFIPYANQGGKVPRADLEWAYNEIFQFTEKVRRQRSIQDNGNQLVEPRRQLLQ